MNKMMNCNLIWMGPQLQNF